MKRVGIYGATGTVGLEAIESLVDHPWFEISHLYASKRSIGKKISEMDVEATDMNRIPEDIDIAFFAFDEDTAKEYELKYASKFAKYLPVITTSSVLRMHKKIPLVITEINPEHLKLAEDYKKEFNSKGFLLPQPNCTAVPLVFCLKPLLDKVGVEEVFVDSYQSVSGAGSKALQKWSFERMETIESPRPYPFATPLENPEVVYDGNIRPVGDKDSNDEQEKVKMETNKILGRYEDGKIIPAKIVIDCMLDRSPTHTGHYEHIRIKPVRSCTKEDVVSIYEEYNERWKKSCGDLPSSPEKEFIILNRYPQPRYDVELGGGMSTVIGGIEIENGRIKLRALSNNRKKGSAKGSVQLMEYLLRNDYF